MKQLTLSIITLLLAFACSQKDDVQRELNISLIPKSAEVPIITQTIPIVYPNPFSQVVFLHLADNKEALINISNTKGLKSIKTTDQLIQLNFNNEKDGIYYMEVLVNGNVYTYTLIKDER